jgi:hypothetical protein|nr:hypothetical protein [Noviherbaspirillum malthae]
MKKLVIAISMVMSFAVVVQDAAAKGCLKGAAVGGVAGHVAGHHGAVGAAAGCAIGHHKASKKEKAEQQAQDANTGVSGNTPSTDGSVANKPAGQGNASSK